MKLILRDLAQEILTLLQIKGKLYELKYEAKGSIEGLWRSLEPFGIEKPVEKKDFYSQFPNPGDFYSSIVWKEKRIKILKRDDYRCHICKRRPATTVHHLNSAYYNPELALDDENLIILCGMCHSKWNRDQELMKND